MYAPVSMPLSIRFDQRMLKQIDAIAKKNDTNRSEAVRLLVAAGLRHSDAPAPPPIADPESLFG